MQEEDTAHEEPYRRKVQAGSAEGHLGPVGSSAGCSGAKLLFGSPFLNSDFSWEHEHPSLMMDIFFPSLALGE